MSTPTIRRMTGNYRYRIEAIIPTCGIVANRFELYDPRLGDPTGSGGIRKFYLEWMESGPDDGATNSDLREATHRVRLHVKYPAANLSFQDLQRIMLEDRHNLIETLRLPSSWRTGWKDDDTTDTSSDTGIMDRERSRDYVDKTNPDCWDYVSDWLTGMRETEIT